MIDTKKVTLMNVVNGQRIKLTLTFVGSHYRSFSMY